MAFLQREGEWRNAGFVVFGFLFFFPHKSPPFSVFSVSFQFLVNILLPFTLSAASQPPPLSPAPFPTPTPLHPLLFHGRSSECAWPAQAPRKNEADMEKEQIALLCIAGNNAAPRGQR